jgi:hypothetical protein
VEQWGSWLYSIPRLAWKLRAFDDNRHYDLLGEYPYTAGSSRLPVNRYSIQSIKAKEGRIVSDELVVFRGKTCDNRGGLVTTVAP